jgi:hypothetical protein
MKIKINYLASIALVCCAFFGWSQKREVLKNVEVSTTHAVYLGKTSLKDNPILDATSRDAKLKGKKLKMQPPNFQGRGKSHVTKPELEHQGNDPLRQYQFNNRAIIEVETLVNVDGLFNDFGSPHDPTGAIGKDHYVQAINATTVGVFDKKGELISQFTGNSLWEPLGETSLGDPIVLYDHGNNQWIITEFASPANLLIAVSETSDPLGDYFVYSFSTPTFPDYPKYAIWGDYIVVTTNESGPGFLHQYFIDRNSLMKGIEDVAIQRVQINGNSSTEAGFYVTSPAHWNGALAPGDNNPIALKINDSSWGEVAEDVVEVFSFEIDLLDGDNTVVTKLSLPVTPFDSYPCDTETGGFACLAQGGSNSGLDAIPEVIMNIPNYRNFGTHESIVFNFITDVTDGGNLSGIRWVEIRRTPGNDWTLYQEGTFAPDDGLHRYMGSIAMDVSGNIGLAYSVSSSSEFAGIRYTGRYADDELGQMTVTETEIVAGTNDISTDRFGDYPHMTVDPVDGLSFWFTSEYAGDGNDNSKTRIAAFRLERKEHDLAVIEIVSPVTSGSLTNAENVEVEIENSGGSTETNFDLTLMVGGELIETFTYTDDLEAGATVTHSFGTTVDFSAIGSYEIEVSVDLDTDENDQNDVQTKEIQRLPEIDLGIDLNIEPEVCGSSALAKAILTNYGGTIITSAEIELFVGVTSLEVVSWEGELKTNAAEELIVNFTGLSSGLNEVSVVINSINDGVDEVDENNSAEASITVDLTLESVTFTLNTDNWPEETTWVLEDTEGNELFTGGPYEKGGATYVETFCMAPDNCYVFTLLDSFGDGICCGEGSGSFSLTDSEGGVLFASDGEFTTSESGLICLGDGVFPAIDVSVELELPNSSVCSDRTKALVLITNNGSEEITSVDLDLFVNDALQETIKWTGSIPFYSSESIEVNFTNLSLGNNDLKVEGKDPNNLTDENLDDNVSLGAVVSTDQENVTFSLIADENANETTWEIRDDSESVIYSGGPFSASEGTEILEPICLDLDGCYSFTIFDSAEDGICCGSGEGSYSLISPAGATIFEGKPDFGFSETTDFCLGTECNLEVTVSVDEFPSGHLISIQANGSWGYMFSIDGGDTFSEKSFFEKVPFGTYDLIVKSQDGSCEYTETLVLEKVLSAGDELRSEIVLSPNPTEGLFTISVSGHQYIKGFLEVQVLDLNGRVIQERKFSRYDDSFEGTISLYAFPDGVYIVKLKNAETNKTSIIVKK